ncbi:hypothetical protein LAZ67_5003094 [Cordylochernes scorpioides]|uniref:Retrotransposon gag domain-containing protein n=1 Tax=Cordylochernes scorpioides TaxID=51811 RepID=A0ABY6KLT2_9ARAC|nr:hypothetical protein LAZ67_5003094 [Cordylochernes scorpioides]
MKCFFHDPEHGLHRKFWQLRKGREQSVKEYYFAKMKIATKLGLSQELILEGLTSGIDSECEHLLIAASPASLERWLEIADALEPQERSSILGVVATQTTKPDDDSLLPGREDRAIGRGTGERGKERSSRDPPWANEEPNREPCRRSGSRGDLWGENKFNIKPLNIQPPRLRLSDKKPVCVRPYRHSLRDRDLIKQQIEQLLKYGLIKPASSPTAHL